MISNNNGPARLLLNQTAPRGHWLEVRLQGVKCNRDGIGARVAVLMKGQKPVWRRAHADGSYLSASDVRVHFGLGQNTEAQVLVQWPDEVKETWSGIHADVTAEAQVLQTDRSDTGGKIESDQLTNVPTLNNRNYQSTLMLVPGVAQGLPLQFALLQLPGVPAIGSERAGPIE